MTSVTSLQTNPDTLIVHQKAISCTKKVPAAPSTFASKIFQLEGQKVVTIVKNSYLPMQRLYSDLGIENLQTGPTGTKLIIQHFPS